MLAVLTHSNTFRAFHHQASGPICDDCLSSRTQIVPGQTVNMNCRRLAKANQLVRIDYDSCYHYGGARRCNTRVSGVLAVADRSLLSAKADYP